MQRMVLQRKKGIFFIFLKSFAFITLYQCYSLGSAVHEKECLKRQTWSSRAVEFLMGIFF